MGILGFCKDMTSKKAEFILWNEPDTQTYCESLDKNLTINSNDLCAELNDNIFTQYHNT